MNDNATCQRCDSGNIAYVVFSALLRMEVCLHCALAAVEHQGPEAEQLSIERIVLM